MNKTALIFCCLFSLFGQAQPEKNNWYFGDRAAISFETGNAVARFDNPQNIYGASASVSDPVTGKLLFYTDAKNIWNSRHQVMAGGGNISTTPAGDVLIVPDPVNAMVYFVFFTENRTIKYAKVDMNSNGGEGSVILAPVSAFPNQMAQFTVMYHPYRKAFWLISHTVQSDVFNASFFDERGSITFTSFNGIGLTPQLYGDMVMNHTGTKIAVTHYQGNDEQVEVFDFDPVCGIFSDQRLLGKLSVWDRAYGAAFSADDSKLYITYSYQQSHLVQYSGEDFGNYYLIANVPDNLNIIRLANDGKMYIATHDGGIPGPRIDVVLKPDETGPLCNYAKTYLTTDNGTARNANFELPAYACGKPFAGPENVFTISGACLGQSSPFKFSATYPVDSFRWDFGDGGNTSVLDEGEYIYVSAGKFAVTLTIYKCGTPYKVTDTVIISNPPKAPFPADTILCSGSAVTLAGPPADTYLWSTGATTASVVVKKPGLVWLRSGIGNCFGTDSIDVAYHPDLFTALGDEYFICSDDKELVKLDAGEGFEQYKWTPTGDTSQWVVVGDLGQYFVVVKDFRGCDGKDGTKVHRRCPVSVFYPNVFTPNNDGLNDLYLPVGTDVTDFLITIYNAWGQKVFTSNQLNTGWDGTVNGKPAPDGTYIYRSVYAGYRNKQPVRFETNGNLTLLR